jgi:hypothetical protein
MNLFRKLLLGVMLTAGATTGLAADPPPAHAAQTMYAVSWQVNQGGWSKPLLFTDVRAALAYGEGLTDGALLFRPKLDFETSIVASRVSGLAVEPAPAQAAKTSYAVSWRVSGKNHGGWSKPAYFDSGQCAGAYAEGLEDAARQFHPKSDFETRVVTVHH